MGKKFVGRIRPGMYANIGPPSLIRAFSSVLLVFDSSAIELRLGQPQ